MILVVATLFAAGAYAQHQVGEISIRPKVGGTLTNLVGDNSNGDYKAGIVAGVEAAYQVADRWAVSAGALYSMQGYKWAGHENGKTNMDYINIPILANFYIIKGLAVKAGIQPGVLVSAKSKPKHGSSHDIKDNCKSFDFSVPVGASYEFHNFIAELRYNAGLTKVFKGDEDANIRNSVFQATIGYNFNL